jgi:hypothetical protein
VYDARTFGMPCPVLVPECVLVTEPVYLSERVIVTECVSIAVRHAFIDRHVT